MQTFLPYPSFMESADVLDKKRCWKQVVEAAQIISVLEGKSVAWQNHPAVKMWSGHIPALKAYFNSFLNVSVIQHGIKTKYVYYKNEWKSVSEIKNIYPTSQDKPWWFGNEDFHRAMRARLIEKDEAFYLPLFPKDKGFNDSKYFWPVMDGTETFRII